jgi:hypothetical protein
LTPENPTYWLKVQRTFGSALHLTEDLILATSFEPVTMPLTRPENAPAYFHVMAKPTGAICNLDCKYCFFLSKEALYPGRRGGAVQERTGQGRAQRSLPVWQRPQGQTLSQKEEKWLTCG